MEIKYLIYFLIGGTIVSAVTYLASKVSGLWAAFLANLPTITLVSFLTIYLTSGQGAVVSFAKGLLIMLLPWIVYITAVILLTPKLNLLPAIAIGISLYLLIAFLILTKTNFKI